MEGKETRFGIAASTLFAAVTTAASCGAVNAMHDSFMPLGGAVPLVLIQLGEVVFGGVGSGLYGMLVFAILTVFIAGLMIGRTPEYLGKKIETYDMKMVVDRDPRHADPRARGHRHRRRRRGGPGRHRQSRRARLFRDPLRLQLGGQQQRQRLRRPLGQHAVLQRAAGRGDVVRPLRRDRAGARGRRLAGREEAPAGRRRHACRRTGRCSCCC